MQKPHTIQEYKSELDELNRILDVVLSLQDRYSDLCLVYNSDSESLLLDLQLRLRADIEDFNNIDAASISDVEAAQRVTAIINGL